MIWNRRDKQIVIDKNCEHSWQQIVWQNICADKISKNAAFNSLRHIFSIVCENIKDKDCVCNAVEHPYLNAFKYKIIHTYIYIPSLCKRICHQILNQKQVYSPVYHSSWLRILEDVLKQYCSNNLENKCDKAYHWILELVNGCFINHKHVCILPEIWKCQAV